MRRIEISAGGGGDAMVRWRDLRGGLRTRWLYFERLVGDVRRHETRPALTVEHVWPHPLHEIPPEGPPERRLIVHALLERARRVYRNGVRFRISDRLLEKDLEELVDRISYVLEKPIPLPRRSSGAWRKRSKKATNIGLEIEVNAIYVEARIGGRKNSPVINAKNGGFLAKCMLYESPEGFTGFSVQSDGGHVELVSDPPTRGLSPAETAAAMARYVKDVQGDLLTRENGTGKWIAARRAVPDGNGVHQALEHRGRKLRVRLQATRPPDGTDSPPPPDGTFHVTVGVHLSAIPWLFASGAEFGDPIESPNDVARGDPGEHPPLPGYVFRNGAKVGRKGVLEQMQGLRRSSVGLTLSPEFEGFAFLIYTYLGVARTKGAANEKKLSPKQHFLVLARTDFASMLKLTSEWKKNRRGWVDKGQELGTALLEQVEEADRPMFNDRFGDPAPPLSDVLDAALGNGDDLTTRVAERAEDDAVYTTIDTTPEQWLDKLFAADPSDMLTPDYQRRNNTGHDPALYRGMGELGNKTDDISVGAPQPFKAPLLELRQVTPDGKKPELGNWESFTGRVVDMITALNAPASRDDVKAGLEELEWIRASSDGPRFGPPGQTAAERGDHADRICRSIEHSMRRVRMRAELWTLLDRVRNLTKPGKTVRGALDQL